MKENNIAKIDDLEMHPRVVGEPFKLERRKDIHICGEANKGGNVQLTYRGGCGEVVILDDAYRCGGCGGWFHKDCMYKHFELERNCDYGRVQAVKEFVEFLKDHYWDDFEWQKQILFKHFDACMEHFIFDPVQEGSRSTAVIYRCERCYGWKEKSYYGIGYKPIGFFVKPTQPSREKAYKLPKDWEENEPVEEHGSEGD